MTSASTDAPRLRRTFARGKATVYDCADSANLYLSSEQGVLYERLLRDSSYAKNVVQPLADGVSVLPALLRLLGFNSTSSLTICDCGPGSPAAAVRQVEAFASVAPVRVYIAIDVNQGLLASVASAIEKSFDIPVVAINSAFESVRPRDVEHAAKGKLLYSFGATSLNYEPRALHALLRSLARPGSLLFLDALLHNGLSDADTYSSPAVQAFAFGPLDLMGAKRKDFTFRCWRGRDRLTLGFQAQTNARLHHPRVSALRRDDVVLTAFSRRPTLSAYQRQLAALCGVFHTAVLDQRVASSIGVVSREAKS